MECKVCKKLLTNPKAKYCSGACKMKDRRGVTVKESVTVTEADVTVKDDLDPVWKRNGMKSKQEAFEKIFAQLKKDEKKIMSKGTSDTLLVSVGEYSMILRKHGKG